MQRTYLEKSRSLIKAIITWLKYFDSQAKKDNDLPQHSPLPKCHCQNEDPTGVHAKAAKMVESKAAKKRDKAAETEAAKQKLAEMEADESFVQAQEQRGRIRRRSDMKASLNDSDDDLEGKLDKESDGEELEIGKKHVAKVSFDWQNMHY